MKYIERRIFRCSLGIPFYWMSSEFGNNLFLLLLLYNLIDPLYFSFVWNEECCIDEFTVLCAYFQRDYALETIIAQVLVEGYTNIWLACALKMLCFIQKRLLNWFSLWLMKLVCSSLCFQFSADYVKCKIKETSLVICCMFRTQIFICKWLLAPSAI